MLDGFGEVFEGARVSFKPWPSCRGTHAFIEAALQIARAPSFAADRIVAIHAIVSPFFQALCNPPEQKRRPRTAIDAKFSVPFTTAVALAHGGVRLEHFSPAGRGGPGVLRGGERRRARPQQDGFRGAHAGPVTGSPRGGRGDPHFRDCFGGLRPPRNDR